MEIEESEQEIIEKVKRQIERDTSKVWHYITEPKHIKILKIITILIALGIIGFLIYNNFLISEEFNYFYDIGGEEDAKNMYLTPKNRVSDIIVEDNLTYRDMEGHLIYFDIPILEGSRSINIETRFKDNLPENNNFSIGAKDLAEWNYISNIIYNKKINTNSEWVVYSTKFYIYESNLYIKNKQLNLFFNARHLGPDKLETNHLYIPIDYINITVYKPGMVERMKNGESFIEALKGVTN
jgi:hypothetical protein